jgi:hypothetical protein
MHKTITANANMYPFEGCIVGKSKLAISLLILILLVSVAANVYFLNQNIALTNEGKSDATKVQMTTLLSAVQVSTDAEIKRIGQSLTYAAQQLGTTGLTGSQADAILNALTANSTYIINSATENLQNIIVAAEPANWSYIEGRHVGEQTYLNPNPNGEITPVMTPVIPLQSDMMGNALAAPVFNSQKELIGTVSVIFDPAKLLNNTVTTALVDTGYTMTVMQTNGLMVFDTDPLQLYKNMFTDPAYANYTQLLLLGHHVADYSSGNGSYRFTVDAASNIVVNKDCYWTTVYAYGQEWRLALQHSLI